MSRAGYLFKQTQPEGNCIAAFDPNIDMDMATLVMRFREFAIACGYSEETVSKYLPEES